MWLTLKPIIIDPPCRVRRTLLKFLMMPSPFQSICTTIQTTKTPLILATDVKPKMAQTPYLLYNDRWTAKHPPLAAKQMIGLHCHLRLHLNPAFGCPNSLSLLAPFLLWCRLAIQLFLLGFGLRSQNLLQDACATHSETQIFPLSPNLTPKFGKRILFLTIYPRASSHKTSSLTTFYAKVKS